MDPYRNLEFMVQQEQSFTAVTHLCSFVPHMQRTNIYLVTGTPNESPFIWLIACFIGLQKLDFSGWESVEGTVFFWIVVYTGIVFLEKVTKYSWTRL